MVNSGDICAHMPYGLLGGGGVSRLAMHAGGQLLAGSWLGWLGDGFWIGDNGSGAYIFRREISGRRHL